jgi:hypothetical protein
MNYTDQNEYHRRINVLQEVMTQHPELMKTLSEADRASIKEYFLDAAASADAHEYRVNLLKAQPMLEIRANKAYERFLAEAGLPETLRPT